MSENPPYSRVPLLVGETYRLVYLGGGLVRLDPYVRPGASEYLVRHVFFKPHRGGQGGVETLNRGEIISLDAEDAAPFVANGAIEPVGSTAGELVEILAEPGRR